jgi:hypothetical protein
MLNFKKIAFILIFFINFIVLLSLRVVFSINIHSFPFNYELASNPTLKVILLLLVTIGELFLVILLTKLKISRNLSNYQINEKYYAFGPLLIHSQHHPNCSCYSKHELTFQNHNFCSGCYGSSLGILIGIFFLISTQLIQLPFEVYFYTGILFIQLALVKIIFSSYIRLLLNVFFPLGVNLILSSCFVNEDAIIYALLFIPFLLVEFLVRLLLPNFETIPETCPDGIHH